MKRLVGGDYLLDLTPIDIEESVDVETYTNITNTDVITQLTNLKKYVSNPSMIKPVWVELKNDETDELVVARGEFKVVDDGEFEIVVQLDGYKLKIHVEFTQALNTNNESLDDWFIDTNDAKYLFISDAQSIGAISELPVFENIVDKEGHKRFIEGDITPAEISGIEFVYAKWSLSGTHLMLVMAFKINEEVALTKDQRIAEVNIPKWIYDKIFPQSTFGHIEQKNIYGFNNSLSQGNAIIFYITKTNNKINITSDSNQTLTTSYPYYRLQFDLLIDNE